MDLFNLKIKLMNWKRIVIRSFLLITIGVILGYCLVGDDFNFAIVFPIIGLFLFGIFFFILTIIKDIKQFKISKLSASFIPTLTGLLVIIVTIIVVDKINSPNTSHIIIVGNHDSGVAHCWLTLRVDKTYEYSSYSPLGGSVIKGNYTLSDSIITLDKQKFDEALTTNKLLISTINHSNKTLRQIDNTGHEIPDAIFFLITIDNRRKSITTHNAY